MMRSSSRSTDASRSHAAPDAASLLRQAVDLVSERSPDVGSLPEQAQHDLLEFLRKTLRPSGRWGASLEGNDALTLRVMRALMAVQEAGG